MDFQKAKHFFFLNVNGWGMCFFVLKLYLDLSTQKKSVKTASDKLKKNKRPIIPTQIANKTLRPHQYIK